MDKGKQEEEQKWNGERERERDNEERRGGVGDERGKLIPAGFHF